MWWSNAQELREDRGGGVVLAMIRRLSVGAIAAVIAAPVAFIGLAMSLMVAELVIYPTVTLLTALITGLVASWLADALAGDEQRTDLNEVIRRNLAWGLVPALGASGYFWLGSLFPPVFLLAAVLIWTGATAARFAFRHRKPESGAGSRVAQSAAWLVGAALAVAAIIFVASLFGLTGT